MPFIATVGRKKLPLGRKYGRQQRRKKRGDEERGNRSRYNTMGTCAAHLLPNRDEMVRGDSRSR